MANPSPVHKWKPGQSGNPKGRAPGTSKVAKLRDAITEHVPEIVQALIVAAKNGDSQAARLLLERTVPAVRPTDLPQALPLPDGASLTDTGRAILRTVAAGELGAHQGATLIAALSGLVRVAELEEIEKRLAALEAQHPDAAR
jgi:hypothetical protein